MKKSLAILMFGLAVMSCKKDDVCNIDQFVGTWKGNVSCTLAGSDTETIVVTKTSDTKLVLNGAEFVSTTVTRDDCSVSGGVTLLGVGNKITGSISADGKTLTIVSEITGGISLEKCTYTLTK